MINNYDNIPQELKEKECWVGWKKQIEGKKIKKVPFNPSNGCYANPTNTQTWGTFEKTLSEYQNQTYGFDGIGFVFTPENSYVGIDIDHCVDEYGNINEFAQKIISQVNSYTEYSPSGTGIHILCKGERIIGKKRDEYIGLEMYSESRYFTITGNRIHGSQLGIEERSEEVKKVHEKYLGEQENSISKDGREGTANQGKQGNMEHGRGVARVNQWTEEELIEKAKHAKRGDRFEQLFQGNWQLHYETQSQAEIGFANMLAFWTAKDIEMMDRIYRMSGLKRDKWDRALNGSTYGRQLLEDAIAKCYKVYDRPKRVKDQGKVKENSGEGYRENSKMEKSIGEMEAYRFLEDTKISYQEPKTHSSNQYAPWYQILPNGNLKFFPAVLAKYLSENIKVVYANGQAYKYEEGVYFPAEDIELDRIVKDHLRNDHATMYAIRDVRNQWMIECSRDRVEFDLPSSAHIINLKNGLYDIQKQELLTHSSEYHSLIQLDCSYVPDAKCEKFTEFMNQVLPPESVLLAQEIVGYILVPMTKAQKSFIIYGPGGTGKSTFIRVIESLVGKQNASNIAWQDLTEKFLLAQLSGKLLNTFSDLPDKALKDLGMFRSLTGEDRVTAEIKFKDPFQFLNKARFVFSTNHLPQILGDNGDSFYRRIIILPFENKVAKEEIDRQLTEKLVSEKNGIFFWALEGLTRLIKNNFKFSENKFTQKVLAKYQRESSSVRWFIEENCDFDSNSRVRKVELFERYQQSCKQDGIKPVDKVKFNNEMEESYPSQVTEVHDGRSRRAFWQGIKLI